MSDEKIHFAISRAAAEALREQGRNERRAELDEAANLIAKEMARLLRLRRQARLLLAFSLLGWTALGLHILASQWL